MPQQFWTRQTSQGLKEPEQRRPGNRLALRERVRARATVRGPTTGSLGDGRNNGRLQKAVGAEVFYNRRGRTEFADLFFKISDVSSEIALRDADEVGKRELPARSGWDSSVAFPLTASTSVTTPASPPGSRARGQRSGRKAPGQGRRVR